jgi:hypothetical protein
MPPEPDLIKAFLAHRDMSLDDNSLALAPNHGRTRIKGTDPRVRQVTDRIGRGYLPNESSGRERMVADMQAEAAGRRPSDADVNDDFARRLMGGADAQAGKVQRTRITGRGQVPRGWDEEGYRYHYSPEENFEGIRERGFDPSLKKGYSKGTHFMPGPDYPALEDNPGNYYRVREDVAPFKNVSTDDFYTEQRIHPRDVEVYTGTPEMPTRWSPVSNAYSKGATGLGLYGLLSSFFPNSLPQIYGPTDWVLQDVMRQNYGPGGVMDPYRDYEGPRDPETGAILA